MSYVYDSNQIDLLEVRQTTGSNNELLRSLTYNFFHEPLTDADAGGQTTTRSYDTFGQVLTVENPRHEITTYAYGDGSSGHPVGYLTSITKPIFNGSSPVTSFTYDSANRVGTTTSSPDNYTVTTDYDNLDRPTQITYPDGTTQGFQYTDNERGMTLDLTASKDRLNRWTYRHYDANRQMDSITDPLAQTTRYGWCTCGALTSITDPNGNVTTFNRDLQRRLISKVFQNTSVINYTYEGTTARLKSMSDANGQTTNYQYYVDNDLKQVSYANALAPTPTVTFIYDPNYNRITSMTDGSGITNYTYYAITTPPVLGAGKLKDVDGPLANDTITDAYDELGRIIGQSINGVASSVAFDSLGRLATSDNTLGHFSRIYDGVTSRLQEMTYPNGVRGDYTYFDNMHDRRLQTLRNSSGNGATTLSQFDYVYDPEAQIQTLTKNLSGHLKNLSLNYDDAKELTSVGIANQTFQYTYDGTGNRYDVRSYAGGILQAESYYTVNNLNQLDSVSANGTPSVALHYDANGNLTDDAAGKTYEWDAANRLVAIKYTATSSRTEFAYDGLGRRMRITEFGPGMTATVQPEGTDYILFRFQRSATEVLALTQLARLGTLYGVETKARLRC
jgi:YD repeat-containing protein